MNERMCIYLCVMIMILTITATTTTEHFLTKWGHNFPDDETPVSFTDVARLTIKYHWNEIKKLTDKEDPHFDYCKNFHSWFGLVPTEDQLKEINEIQQKLHAKPDEEENNMV